MHAQAQSRRATGTLTPATAAVCAGGRSQPYRQTPCWQSEAVGLTQRAMTHADKGGQMMPANHLNADNIRLHNPT